MYPTLVAGIALIGCAVGFAVAPDARRRALIRALAVLTSLCALTGFTTGLIKTCSAANGDHTVYLIGFGESLNNLGLGLVLLVAASIATVIGVARRSESTDEPHGI